MSLPEPCPSNVPSLYELYISYNQCPQNCDRQGLVWALVLHPEFRSKLGAACKVVLHHWPAHSDLREELGQHTLLRLCILLLTLKPVYHDFGIKCFNRWIWKFILTGTQEAWRYCRPLWLRRIRLIDAGRLEKIALSPKTADDSNDLVGAIKQVKNPRIRQVLDDRIQNRTIADSAQMQGLSMNEVRELRRRGIVELRHLLQGE